MHAAWHKNAIIYSLDVENFQDSNGDGIGDFPGLTSRLNYLSGLGVTCLWLLPFYPTPNRDDGYDVIDYYAVDPRLGTLGHFVEFMHQARERGIRVIVDLVVNHTSDRHPWFQAARRDRDSPFRNYYVWSETKPEDTEEGMIFPGVQESIWSHDPQAGAWYLHRFYKHQPDLNIANPAVREEIRRIMGFWLELGVSGFRLDAAPFLIELKGIDEPDVENPYHYLREFRNFLSWRRGDAVMLAEANVDPETAAEYFGDGQRMHMLFHFTLNQALFLALARGDKQPIVEALKATTELPEVGQWATFLRTHDELDLGRLSDDERQEVYAAFAPEEHMRLYDRGIRRRLPPMLGGDPRRIRLAYSLLLTLPGSPILRYGDELGMGDDLSLDERQSVRTAMQWSDEENGGFSTAARDQLVRPVITGGQYGYEQLNVTDQRRHADSLLNWMERMIRMRKECPEFGFGRCSVLETGDAAILAHWCETGEDAVLAIHNLSSERRSVSVGTEPQEDGRLVDVLGDHEYAPLPPGCQTLELDPYGFRWFRLTHACRPQVGNGC